MTSIFSYKNINFHIITNKDYNIVSVIDPSNSIQILLNKINLIISQMQNCDIIEIIIKELEDTKPHICNDFIGIFNSHCNTKCVLDKSKLYEKYLTLQYNDSLNLLNKIPKELLLNRDQIFQLIILEIEKINTNMSFDHYIECKDNNIFNLIVRFKYKDGLLAKYMKKFKKEYGYDTFEILLELSQLYPYIPPNIVYIRPKINSILIHNILDIDIFKISNWNYMIPLDIIIINMSKILEPYFLKYISIDQSYNLIEMKLLELECKINKNFEKIPLNVFNIIDLKSNNVNKSYWNSGVGYGTSSDIPTWDITAFISKQKLDLIKLVKIIKDIKNEITNINKLNQSYTLDQVLESYLCTLFTDITLLDFNKISDFYHIILDLLNILLSPINKVSLVFINTLHKLMKGINEDIVNIIDNDIYNLLTYTLYIDVYKNLELIQGINNEIIGPILESNKLDNLTNLYSKMIESEMFKYNILDKMHRYYSKSSDKINSKTLLRILSEISSLKNNLPNTWNSSIVMRVPKQNINIFSFLIIGPNDTPYHNGIFEFHVYLSDKYPSVPPNILLNTTDGDTIRFNPNLYANGKVCLSLLGTWRGEQGETWNPELSTLLQIIISIQSLILVEQPYFNEPGYEKTINTVEGNQKTKEYNEYIRLQTIRVAMCNTLKNKIPSYETFIEQHFKFKKEEIILTVNKWYEESDKYKNEMKTAIDELTLLL